MASVERGPSRYVDETYVKSFRQQRRPGGRAVQRAAAIWRRPTRSSAQPMWSSESHLTGSAPMFMKLIVGHPNRIRRVSVPSPSFPQQSACPTNRRSFLPLRQTAATLNISQATRPSLPPLSSSPFVIVSVGSDRTGSGLAVPSGTCAR